MADKKNTVSFDEWANGEEVKPAKTGILGRAGDLGLSALKSAISVPETAVGLANIASGGKAGKAVESAGIRFKDAKDILDAQKSDAAKDAEWRLQNAEGFTGKLGAAIENPSLIANTLVESAAPMLAGGLAGRGLSMAAPRLAGYAGAIGEGAIGAGSAAEQIRQESTDGELSGKQAALAGASGLATGLLGYGGSKLAGRLGVGDIDTALAGGARTAGVQAGKEAPGMLKRIGGGALSEGVFEELPQSVSEQMLQNAALDRDPMQGVDAAAAMGLLSGGLMGGGMGVVSGQPKQQAAPAQPPVAPTTTPGAPPAATPPTDPTLGQSLTGTPMADLIGGGGLTGGANPLQAGLSTLTSNNQMYPGMNTEPTGYTVAPETGAIIPADPVGVRQMAEPAAQVEAPAPVAQAPVAPAQVAPTLGESLTGTPVADMLDTRTPSQRMGLNPESGGLTAAAAIAVDSGASPATAGMGLRALSGASPASQPVAEQANQQQQAQPPAQQPILNNGKPFTLAEVGQANQAIGGTAVSVPGGWAIQPPQAAQKPAATPDTAMPTAATPAASVQSAILGRNSQPIAEGGQPFATREEAKAEKRMQPLMRVAPAEGGGFILKPASERQLAAVEKAAKRLKYPSTGETGPRSLHGFILQIGGLASGTMPDVGFDLNPRVGNRRLFSPRGKTIEQAAMAAKQEGYIQDEDENTLIEALKRSLNVSPVYTPDGYEAMAEAQMQARYEDFLAAEQDGGAENDWSRLTPEELADTGYNDYDEATQAEIRALVAQAEALGVDAESILEDVAQRTENATQKDYENAAKSAIEAAIRSSEESRSRDLGQAGAEAGPATADTQAAPAAVTGPASDVRARNLAALKARMMAGQTKPTPATPPAQTKASPAPEAGPTNQGAANGQGQETLLKAEQPTGAAAMVSGAPVAEQPSDTTKPGGFTERVRKAAGKVDTAPAQQPSGSIDGIVIKPGKGLIKGKFKAEVDGVGLPGDAFNTEQEAYDAALRYREVLAKRANEGAEAQRRKDAIADSFRNGDQVTNAQIESLGLKSDFSDMRWFMSTAADLFGLNSRQIRPIVKDLIKVRRSDMGTEYEYVPTRNALEAIAASQSLTSPTKADIEAQQARAEQAAKAKAAQDKADTARAAKERERKDVAAASVAAADTFELGQDAMANLTGQNDLQFSRAAAKEVRDLVTLHNLSEDNLMYAGKMGGIPVPSIGITKVETPFGGFGGITLIAQKDLIDPESGVPVYDRDAWTARFPKLNFKKVKAKVADAFYERMQSVRDFGSDGGQFMSMLFEELRNSNVQAPDKITSLFTRYTAPKMLYAQEVLGKTIKPPMRDIKSETPFGHAKSWRDFVAKNYKAGMTEQQEKEFNRLAAVAARAAMAEINTENKARVDERTARMLDSSMNGYLDRYISENYGMNAGILDRAVRDVKSFGKKEVDPMKLDEAVRKVVPTDDAGYTKWISNLVEPLFEAPTITLRGAEVPVTLDNIVDAMTIGKTAGAEKSMTFGAGKAASMLGKQFKSIDEIKAARDRVVSTASESDGKKSTEALISEYQNHVSEFYTGKDWKGNIDTWAALDSSLEALTKAGRNPTDGTMRIALQRSGFKRVDAKGISLAKQALEALRDATTDYFEAKPQRAVRLNEFNGAVVPKGTSAEAIALLEENGITVEVHGNAEGAREKAIQRLAKKLDGKTGNVIFSRDTESPRTQAPTIRAAITKAYGNLLDKLEAKGLVTIAQTEREAIEAAAQARADKTGGDAEAIAGRMMSMAGLDVKYSANGNIEGFFDRQTGKSFLVADNLTAASAPGTLMHEVGIHMAADGKLESLFKRAGSLLKTGTQNEFIQRVKARMARAGETSDEEAAAYIVTEYENDRAKAPITIGKWLADLTAAVRAWLFSNGIILKADQLTVADIAAVARANARSMARGGPSDGAGGGQSFSRSDMPATLNIDGKDRPTTNSNGQPIHPTEEGVRNFWKWFGDSKVVESGLEELLSKPDGVGVLLRDLLAAQNATGSGLNPVQALMLALAKNDKIGRGIVGLVPVDVVNSFSKDGLRPEDGSGNTSMFVNALNAPVSDQVLSTFRGILTSLSTKLANAIATGRDQEIAPALLASDFNLREVGGLLSLQGSTDFWGGNTGVKSVSAGEAAKSTSPGLGSPAKDFKLDATALADLFNKFVSFAPHAKTSVSDDLPSAKYIAKQGKPLVVYHGTAYSFDEFDPGMAGATYGADDEGIFFTTDTEEADVVSIDARNDDNEDQSGSNVMPVFLLIKNPLTVSFDEFSWQSWEIPSATNTYDSHKERILSRFRAGDDDWNDYDGIVITGKDKHKTFVAFNPTQIKSATGNTGAFSPTDTDIRFSRAADMAGNAIDKAKQTADKAMGKDFPRAASMPDLNDDQRSLLGKVGASQSPASDAIKAATDRAGLKIRQAMVDRFAALKELDEKALGQNFIADSITNSAWVLAKMSSAGAGALNAMMKSGRIEMDAAQKVIGLKGDPNGGLTASLQKLGGPAEVERFFAWMAANRSHAIIERNKEAIAKTAEAKRELKNIIEMQAIPGKTAQQVSQLSDARKEWERIIAKHEPFLDVTERLFTDDEVAAGRTLNTGTTEDGKVRPVLYSQVHAEFQQYRDDVLAIAEQAGIINSDNRAMWRDEFYVPFYRVMEDDADRGRSGGNGLSRQEAYKKLKGGKQNLNDLMENTLMNFHHLLSASLKNQAAVQAIKNAEHVGIARKVPEARRDTKTSTFVLVDGKKVFYEVDDPLVFESITTLADPGLNNTAVRVMGAFKRLFTNMTTATPQFIIANTFRDLLQASATSPTSKNIAKNLKEGIQSYRDEKTRAEMLASGGAFSFGHIYGMSADEVKESLQKTVAGAGLISSPSMIPSMMRKMWDAWSNITDLSENASRAATYTQNVDQMGKLRAAFEARDVMDFSQHGAWPAVRLLVRIVPFLNARLQGLDKLYRSGLKPSILTAMGKGTDTDKQAAARFAMVTGALTLATMALYLINADDDEYKKLEEWQKDTYWFIRIGENAFFLPKPFEVGAIATVAERTLQQAMDDKATGRLFRERMWDMLMQTFAFNPTPQMFQPLVDVYSNKDAFTGRDIESAGMERMSTGLRSRDTTTAPATALSAVSRVFGDESSIAVSPVQADHLIKGYLGGVGAMAAGWIDTMYRAATGQSSPDKAWSEYQPIRRFYRDLDVPVANTRYATLFYDGLKEANRVYADVMELQKLGRPEDAATLAAEKRNVLQMRIALNAQQRRLTEINNRMKEVRRSDKDGEWKRREIDLLNTQKAMITERMGKRIEDARAQ